MSSYVEESLTRGERLLYRARLSWWAFAPQFLAGAVVLLAPSLVSAAIYILAVPLSLAIFGGALLRYYTTELAITNKRVIAKTGLLSRHTVELNLAKIESIRVAQPVMGRIFDYGSIVVAGAGNPSAPILGISSPMAFRRAFLEAQEAVLGSPEGRVRGEAFAGSFVEDVRSRE